MATAAQPSNAARRRKAFSKRTLSHDMVLPDVTNIPDAFSDVKPMTRAVPHQRSVSLSYAALAEVETLGQICTGGQTRRQQRAGSSMEENQGQPERAAKIAARAKMKAVLTPYGHGRRKKQALKAPQAPQPSPPSLTRLYSDESMDIDSPSIAIQAFRVQVPEFIVDIDDHEDFTRCPEYAKDIMAYMRSREVLSQLPSSFLDMNPDVTHLMRGILMDWLIQVQANEELDEESLQLCVALTDRYLARQQIAKTQLQLLGITCLLISAKFVERFPPLVATLCALTAGTYSEGEVLEMERHVLHVLAFNLCHPVPHFFLRRYLTVHQHDVQVIRLANYVIDLSLPSINFVSVLPSVLAASALYVSRLVWLPEDPQTWSPALTHYTGYSYNDLASSVVLLAKIVLRAPVSKYKGARRKHAVEETYGAISVDPVLDDHPALRQLIGDYDNR